MRGKEHQTTTLADTTINQISNTSSRVSIECTNFTNFDKRKKNKQKALIKKVHEKNLNNLNNINNNEHDDNNNDNNNQNCSVANTKLSNSVSSDSIFSNAENNKIRNCKIPSKSTSHNDLNVHKKENLLNAMEDKKMPEKEKLLTQSCNISCNNYKINTRSFSSTYLSKLRSDYELSVISSGKFNKSVLIRANSYKTNLS